MYFLSSKKHGGCRQDVCFYVSPPVTESLAGTGKKDFETQEVAPERAVAVFLQVSPPSESVRDGDDQRDNGEQQLLKAIVDYMRDLKHWMIWVLEGPRPRCLPKSRHRSNGVVECCHSSFSCGSRHCGGHSSQKQ